MSNLNLKNLIPEKFTQNVSLLDDYIRVIQDSLISTDTTKIYKHGYTDEVLSSTATSIKVTDSSNLSTVINEEQIALFWNESGDNVGNYEFIALKYSGVPYTYNLTRSRHGSQAIEHPTGTIISKYATISVEEMSDKINGFLDLIDVQACPNEYLQNLADLFSATLTSEDSVSTERRRNELAEIVDWYKVKGTYKSIQLISLIAEFELSIYELFTKNYITFIEEKWVTYSENENPDGLDSTYYKSPHFGLYIDLNKMYSAGSYVDGVLEDHLWRPSLYRFGDATFGFQDYVERTRPVNTVPHYAILLSLYGDESGEVFNVTDGDGNIISSTVVSDLWEYSQIFFDDTDVSGSVDFDEGWYFDGNLTNFLDSLTTWKIGNEDKDLNSGCVQDIPSPVLTGNVSSYWYNDEKIVLTLEIAQNVVQWGMTELAIYQETTAEMMIFCTFPDINKSDDLPLRINITIYRTKDSEKYKKEYYVTTTTTLPIPEALIGLIATGRLLDIQLNWDASVDPLFQYYNVYRALVTGGPYTKISTGVTNSLLDETSENEYLDTDVSLDTTYYYVVTQTNTHDIESSYSNEAEATLEPVISEFNSIITSAFINYQVLDSNFAVVHDSSLGESRNCDINIDQKYVIGCRVAAATPFLDPIRYFDENNVNIPDHFTPDVTFSDNSRIADVHFSIDSLSLYAFENYIYGAIYKFNVSTGNMIWMNTVDVQATYHSGFALDSSGDVFVGQRLYPNGKIHRLASSDGSLQDSSLATGVEYVSAMAVSEADDILVSVGDSNSTTPKRHLVIHNKSTLVKISEFSLGGSYGLSDVLIHGSYIYFCGSRVNTWDGSGGIYANIWKMDSEGNVVDYYDTGAAVTKMCVNHLQQLVIKGTSTNEYFVVITTDMVLVDTHSVSISNSSGDLVAIPAYFTFLDIDPPNANYPSLQNTDD